MLKEAEYEVGLDANEATLRTIQEQLESDSPLWQTEGAHKVRCSMPIVHLYALTAGVLY